MKFKNAIAGSAIALGALGSCATVGTGKGGTGVNNMENASAVDGGVDGGVSEGGSDAKVPGEGELLSLMTKEELHQREMKDDCFKLAGVNDQLVNKVIEVETAYPKVVEICVSMHDACFEAGGMAILSLGEQHLDECQSADNKLVCIKNGLLEEKDWRALRTIELVTNKCLIGTLECSMELIKNQTPETEPGNLTL